MWLLGIEIRGGGIARSGEELDERAGNQFRRVLGEPVLGLLHFDEADSTAENRLIVAVSMTLLNDDLVFKIWDILQELKHEPLTGPSSLLPDDERLRT